MKAPVVILCGGKGERMREETEIRPKPMVEIGGKPILWHIMKNYANHGCTEFVLALGYKGDYIADYFKKSPEPGWTVHCVDTGANTLKGGRIKRLAAYLTGPRFHVTYGDGIGDVDVTALTAFHQAHGVMGSVTAVHPPSRFGEMILEGDTVKAFMEKPQLVNSYINGGFFVFNRPFLECLTEDETCDLEFGALQELAHNNELRVFRHEGFWQCMDNVRERDYLNELYREGKAPWMKDRDGMPA